MNRYRLLAIALILSFLSVNIQAQFTESFDSGIPRTWTIIDNDGQGRTWTYNNRQSYRGAGEVWISFEAMQHDDYLISPQFTVDSAVTDKVSFYAAGSGPRFPEIFEVRLSTSGTAASDFRELLGVERIISEADSNEYVNFNYNLSEYAGQDVYIAIVATSTAQFHLHIDEFSVSALPPCPRPGNIELIELNATSASLRWREGGSESQWIINYGPAGFNPATEGTEVVVMDTSAIILDSLEASTLYDVYVKAICGGSNGESEYTGPYSFVTPCLPALVPYSEGFEEGNTDTKPLAGCWTQEQISGSFWIANSSIPHDNRSPRTGEWDVYLAYGGEAWMFHAVRLEAGIDYTFTLFARQSNTSGASILAAYGNADNSGAMKDTIINKTEVADGEYQEISDTFSVDSAGIYYIGIKGKLRGGFFPFYMTMDDISLRPTSSCNSPTGLEVTDIEKSSFSVNWTPGGAERTWMVKYGEPGFDPNTGGDSVLVHNEADTTIKNLIPAHLYNVFVKAVCDTGVSSSYAGPVTMATRPINDDLCEAIQLEIDEACDTAYSNVGATMEAEEPYGACFEAPGKKTVWFTFIAPASGHVKVSTDFTGGTLEDNEVAIYAAPDDCADLSTLSPAIACDEDGGEVGEGFLAVVEVDSLQAGETYYIQVNGLTLFSGETAVGSFCIEVINMGENCPAPSELAVSLVRDSSALLTWTAGFNETEWEVIYGDEGFDPLTEGESLIVTDSAGIHLRKLEPAHAYEAYVRAICSTRDSSTLIGPVQFTTDESTAVLKPAFMDFTFYPNPVRNAIHLKADFPIEEVKIYSLLGDQLTQMQYDKTELSVDTRNLNPGVYILMVKINDTTQTYLFTKM